ncbi:hypothetical protein WJX79_003280 [Trebouxia sp. C0005]
MSERLSPWRSRPSEVVLQMIENVPGTQLFLMQRQGPMSFVLCEDGAECNHKVLLGPKPTCSCRRGRDTELCIHHIFVMLRVLRLPPNNPIIWQLSLIDRELDEALWQAGSNQLVSSSRDTQSKASAANHVNRRPLEQEDACSICYGDMHERGSRSAPELVWCGKGCGHNVHARCLNVWAKHQTTLKQELTCPMCRTPWGPFSWRPAPALQRAHHKHAAHYGSHCKGCEQGPVVGRLYTCLTCSGTTGPVQLLKQNHTNPTSSQLSKRAPGKHTVSVLREMNQPACGAQSDQGLAALSIGIRGGSVISSQQLQQSGSSRLTSSDQAGSNEQIVAKKGVSKPASAGKLRAAVSPTPTGQQYILQDVVGMGFDPGNERLAARQPESQILKGLKGQAEQRTLSSSGCERRNRPFLGRAQQQSSCAAALCIPSQLSTCSDPSNHASLQPISVQGLNNSPAGPDKQKPCRREPARQASDASQGRAGRLFILTDLDDGVYAVAVWFNTNWCFVHSYDPS